MADITLCSVESCGKPIRGRGLCSGHHHRLLRYGDATFIPPKKVRPQCSLDGCLSPHYGHGYCLAHYKRWRKWGDPLDGSTPWGEVRKWIETIAIPYTGDECLTFPYCRVSSGYGRFNIGDRTIGAHVFILEQTTGPKPTPKHECCHSCGNGHEGCVNPLHLYWGTRVDNMEDARRHGTLGTGYRVRGESHPSSKITDIQLANILVDLDAGILQVQIAEKYGISQTSVSRIKIRRSR
jgi:hypothetical protein